MRDSVGWRFRTSAACNGGALSKTQCSRLLRHLNCYARSPYTHPQMASNHGSTTHLQRGAAQLP